MTVSVSAEATLSAPSIDGSSVVKSEPACPDDMYETSQLPRYTEIKTELPEDIEVDVENHSPMPNNQSHDTQVDKYVEKIMKLTNIQCYQNNSELTHVPEYHGHMSKSLSIIIVYLVISCLLSVQVQTSYLASGTYREKSLRDI